jgi:hypothetical protein
LTGFSKNAPNRDYSVNGSQEDRVFGAVNAVSIIVTTYACGIVPEIQVLLSLYSHFVAKKNGSKKKNWKEKWKIIDIKWLAPFSNLRLSNLKRRNSNSENG